MQELNQIEGGMKTPISAILVVKNEENRIARVLDSLSWVEDIVVVDDFSSDRTPIIAREKGANVLQRKWEIEGRHRNWAISQAKYDWVFVVDGDEIVSPKLAKTIMALTKDLPKLEAEGIYGIGIPMRMFIGNIWVRHPGWDPACQLRFFNRQRICYSEEEIHPAMVYKGKIRTLTLGKKDGQIIHFSYDNFAGMIDKVNSQTNMEAKKRIRLNRRYNGFNAVRKFFSHFLKEYTVRGGWKTGIIGLYISFCAGFYQLLTWFKMKEMDFLYPSKSEKIIFMNRDGVINQSPGYGDYVKNWQEFSFIPRSVDALRRLTNAGYKIVIVSNQPGVGEGVYSSQALKDITDKMLNELKQNGVDIEDVFYCTHRPEENCQCRMPNTLFFDNVLSRFNGVDYNTVFMVGNREEDVEAGKNVGIKTALVISDTAKKYHPKEWLSPPDVVRKDLLEFVEKDLQLGKMRN